MNHDSDRDVAGADVVSAYHRFRAADSARQARVRAATGLGDNELRVLQLLSRSERDQHAVMPSEIARHLGISSASTTALLDRLARSGALERVSHPTDRRSIIIALTPAATETLEASVNVMDRRIEGLADALDGDSRARIAGFFDAMTAESDLIVPSTLSA